MAGEADWRLPIMLAKQNRMLSLAVSFDYTCCLGGGKAENDRDGSHGNDNCAPVS